MARHAFEDMRDLVYEHISQAHLRRFGHRLADAVIEDRDMPALVGQREGQGLGMIGRRQVGNNLHKDRRLLPGGGRLWFSATPLDVDAGCGE